MRSSSGQYFVGLDHLRALAALLVFQWHFIHGGTRGIPVVFNYLPNFFPAALFDEGHCGVALFMCLSGYLFAKLLDGKAVRYSYFLWNRFIRLFPLLAVVLLAGAFIHRDWNLYSYVDAILRGPIFPTLPNGGWSITVEFHFYLILPLVLFALRRNIAYAAFIIVVAIILRSAYFFWFGEVQSVAYWTIFGRIDQFVLGMAAFYLNHHITGRHRAMLAGFLLFAAFYWYFDFLGGWYNAPSYPSPYPIWIVMTTVEGLFFCCLIAYYDTTFKFQTNGFSGVLARIGTYSYSIYLMHFFYVSKMAAIYFSWFGSSNFYFAFGAGLVAFAIAASMSSITYHFIEAPFLAYRVKYIQDAPEAGIIAEKAI